MRTRFARIMAAIAAGVVVATTVLPAGPAAAHVSVSPAQAAQGGFAALTFRVPNEREDAATTKVEVHFPADTPIIGATVRQLTGWSSEVRRGPAAPGATLDGTPVTETITSVVWTADAAAHAVTGSNYQEFGVSVGPLPAVDRVVFKALQTYDDGRISRWIDEPADGAPEPESPAVVLRLAAGGEKLDAHGQLVAGADTVAGADAAAAPPVAAGPAASGSSSGVAMGVSIAALVVALAALALVLLRRPRTNGLRTGGQGPDQPGAA